MGRIIENGAKDTDADVHMSKDLRLGLNPLHIITDFLVYTWYECA